MDGQVRLKRRQVLQALGLGFGVYSSPVLLGFNGAKASGASGGSGGSGGSSVSSGGGDDADQHRPARQSRPSEPSRPRRAAPPPELTLLSPSQIDLALSAAGYRVVQQKSLGSGQLYRLLPPQGRTTAQALADLAQRFPAARSDRNSLYRPEEFICDEGSCASHEAIDWTAEISLAEVKIGMIDTGVNSDHEAFAGQKLTVIQSDLGQRAAAGRQHGTAVAALLVGRQGSRTPGLLPAAELIAVEAFHKGAGGETADAYSLVEALDLLLAEGVRVINLSFSGPENIVLHDMVRTAHSAGVALVAAAGNSGPGAPAAYPAAWPEVIAVTAVDARERAYRQANRGDYIGFAAPGVNLWTAASISGGRLKSGTSYAAPFLTAALAARIAQAPLLPLSAHLTDLQLCAKDLGEDGPDQIFGHGMISMNSQCLSKNL